MIKSKKTALLRQVKGWESFLPIRGVVRFCEEENYLTLSLLNLEKKEEGDYYLLLEGQLFRLENLTGQDFYNVETVSKESFIAIIYYDNKSIFPVLIGSFSAREVDEKEVVNNAQKQFKINDDKKAKADVFQEQNYDDEAISTVNYYEYESEREGEQNYLNERAIDNEKFNCCQSSTEKEEKESFYQSNEPISPSNSKFEQEETVTNFYLKIKGELDALFKDYPKEERLCKMVENSKWVKIGDGEKFYAVGIIFKDNQPEYICYGLPGQYTEGQSVKGFSYFIPTSPFDLKGEGYWVSFQNPKDGKCVN